MHRARSVSLAVPIAVALACAAPPPPPTTPGPPVDPSQVSGAVPSPVFSTHPCERDEDCAPVATCHPDRCVSVARAGAMPPGLVCTMECRARTVDCGYNRCGCARSPSGERVCALLPGEGGR